jgi:hypothetical protein
LQLSLFLQGVPDEEKDEFVSFGEVVATTRKIPPVGFSRLDGVRFFFFSIYAKGVSGR